MISGFILSFMEIINLFNVNQPKPFAGGGVRTEGHGASFSRISTKLFLKEMICLFSSMYTIRSGK
jgi:hypothetical protein